MDTAKCGMHQKQSQSFCWTHWRRINWRYTSIPIKASQDHSISPLSDFQIPTSLILGLNQHFPQYVPCNTRPKRCSVKKQFHDQLRRGSIIYTFSSWNPQCISAHPRLSLAEEEMKICLTQNFLSLTFYIAPIGKVYFSDYTLGNITLID